MPLPYKSHPLYGLRNVTSIIAFIGIILCFLCFDTYRPGFIVCFLLFSAIFSRLDVFLYALRRVEHPDEEPKWPNLKIMNGDLLLAVILQFAFWAAVGEITWGYGYRGGPSRVAEAYGILTAFLCSALHAYCFWQQLMARYKDKWLATVSTQSCARCGYSDLHSTQGPTGGSSRADHRQEASPPNAFTYAGPPAAGRRAQTAAPQTFLTPETTDSTMEEGLLIGSDFGSYGSISRSEPVLEQPTEVMVASGKGKKRAAAEKKQGKQGKAQQNEVWVDGIRASRKQLQDNQQAATETWKALTKHEEEDKA